MPHRSRLHQGVAGAVVIALGLFIRSGHTGLPPFWTKYAGDALWALLVFELFGLFFPRLPTLRLAAAAFVYACLTEFSQLYHAPWIDAVRRYPLGRLVLGDTFAWADMAAYLAGVLLGAFVERALTARVRGTGDGAVPPETNGSPGAG